MNTGSPSPETVRILVENHERFLRFLQLRVGNREAAEDILQNAFVRTLEKGDAIRDDERAVGWFYRVLRNAVTDHYRHRAVEGRALSRKAGDGSRYEGPTNSEMESAVCACMKDLIGTLKQEYADILGKAELDAIPIDAIAREAGITPNNAMVRLHRARKALHARLVESCGTCTEHGCLQCTCKPATDSCQ